MTFFHVVFKADAALPWLIAVVLLVGGGWLFLRAARLAGDAYDEAATAARGAAT